MTTFKKCVLSVSATLLIIGCGKQPDAVRKKREPKHPEPAAKNHLYPTNSSPRPSQTTAQTFQAEKPVISVWEAAKTGEMATLKQHALTGTDLNSKTSTGWTPLHFAYSNRKKCHPVSTGKWSGPKRKKRKGSCSNRPITYSGCQEQQPVCIGRTFHLGVMLQLPSR